MEPGEDITEAAKREVLEETGLTFEVTTMFAVECAGQCLHFQFSAYNQWNFYRIWFKN